MRLYIVAYEAAYDNYKYAFDKQRENEVVQINMFIAIALIIPGSILMSAASKHTLSKLGTNISRSAIQTLAKAKAVRTLALYNAIGNNPAAYFAIGKVVDIVKGETNTKIQSLINDMVSKTNGTLSSKPLSRSKQLDSWLENLQLLARETALAIEDSRHMSNIQKERAFEKLQRSPIANRPQGRINVNSLTEKIELGMYMIWVLDSDKLFTQVTAPLAHPDANGIGKTKSISINALPSSAQYPRPGPQQWIGINRPGSVVENRIDMLHQRLYKSKFYAKSGFFGRDDKLKKFELQKAEKVLNLLAASTQPSSALGILS
jgi:hypothetical protein